MASGLESLSSRIAEHGWAVLPGFFDARGVLAWSRELLESYRDGEFRRAGVGRGERRRVRPEVREDDIRWIDPASANSFERRYLELMELLRQTLNRELTLGLFELEAHLAFYPPGARYRCHLDRFQDEDSRVVSTSLYLNPCWRVEDGGALRLYLDEPESEPFEDVPPLAGTLVCFLSDRFHHEVLPARRERLSVTGWFTRRRSQPFVQTYDDRVTA
jgi:SM-20-related protein